MRETRRHPGAEYPSQATPTRTMKSTRSGLGLVVFYKLQGCHRHGGRNEVFSPWFGQTARKPTSFRLQGNYSRGYGPEVQVTAWEQVEHFKQSRHLNLRTENRFTVHLRGQLTYTFHSGEFEEITAPLKGRQTATHGEDPHLCGFTNELVRHKIKTHRGNFTIELQAYVMSQGRILRLHKNPLVESSLYLSTNHRAEMLLKHFIF